jgi:hypothetical protein
MRFPLLLGAGLVQEQLATALLFRPRWGWWLWPLLIPLPQGDFPLACLPLFPGDVSVHLLDALLHLLELVAEGEGIPGWCSLYGFLYEVLPGGMDVKLSWCWRMLRRVLLLWHVVFIEVAEGDFLLSLLLWCNGLGFCWRGLKLRFNISFHFGVILTKLALEFLLVLCLLLLPPLLNRLSSSQGGLLKGIMKRARLGILSNWFCSAQPIFGGVHSPLHPASRWWRRSCA